MSETQTNTAKYTGDVTYGEVTDTVLSMLDKPKFGWYVMLFTCIATWVIGLGGWVFQILYGMGMSGLAHPIMWGVYITNFVFWVGIAHSGTLISAVLYLFRAKFRQPIYR